MEKQPNNTQKKILKNVQDATAVGTRKVVENLSDSTGVNALKGFSIKRLFSETFRKHTEEEMEEYFGVGTPSTTPKLEEITAVWPTPWFFWKILIVGVGAFFGLWGVYSSLQYIPQLLPAILFMGCFLVPLATLIFFFESNIAKNISIFQLLKIFIFAGTIGLATILLRFNKNEIIDTLGICSIAIFEEVCKLGLIIYYVLKRDWLKGKNYILNGLVCGAAVGAGFTAFVSAGNVLVAMETPQDLFLPILVGGIFVPLGPVIWTAMLSATLWRIKKNNKFNFGMLYAPSFIIMFIIVATLHSFWNLAFLNQFGDIGYLIILIIGAIGWLIIFGQMALGIKQIRKMQEEAGITPQPALATAGVGNTGIDPATIDLAKQVGKSIVQHCMEQVATATAQNIADENIADENVADENIADENVVEVEEVEEVEEYEVVEDPEDETR